MSYESKWLIRAIFFWVKAIGFVSKEKRTHQ
jgi:hypothetical protein